MTTITNECSCETYDIETGEYHPAPDCYGDCWGETVEDFTNITEHLFTDNHQTFRITGFPVWNGTINGEFVAKNPTELLRAITPHNTAWRLEYEVTDTELVGRLSHHDAPMGGRIVVTPLSCTHDWHYMDEPYADTMKCSECGDTQR